MYNRLDKAEDRINKLEGGLCRNYPMNNIKTKR